MKTDSSGTGYLSIVIQEGYIVLPSAHPRFHNWP